MLQLQNYKLDIVSAYPANINKPKKQREQFYDVLQKMLDKIPKENKLILAGDFNAKIGNEVVELQYRYNQC